MIIFTFTLLILASFCAAARAETCDVGVEGCSWTCTRTVTGPATCAAIPATPKSCVIGLSVSLCETTCTCIGVNGCSWNCERRSLQPGQFTCDAIPGTPEYCVVGSSETVCGTTCTCSKS